MEVDLLFGKRKPGVPKVVKLEKRVDASDIYYISQAILCSIAESIPVDWQPPIRTRKVKSLEQDGEDCYRVTMFSRYYTDRIVNRNNYDIGRLKPGLFVWKTWFVRKCNVGVANFIFYPALEGESADVA